MITNEMMSKAAEEVNQTIINSLPYSENCNHNFSAKFERKIKYQMSKANHPQIYRFLRQIACFLLVILIGTATLFTFNSEVRAAFFGWIKEQCGTLFSYQFSGETQNPDGIKVYELSIIPKGYHEVDKQSTELDGFAIYMNENGDMLQFVYSGDYENIAIHIGTVGYEKTTVYVNEYEADLYLSDNPGESPGIVWIDTEQNITFLISGFLKSDELIKLAENVIEQN